MNKHPKKRRPDGLKYYFGGDRVPEVSPESAFSQIPCPSCGNEAQKEEYERPERQEGPEGRFLPRYFRVTCWHCGYLYDSGDFDD